MAKYFGGDTPFEGYAPLYQVKQREGQTVRDFGVTLTMLGIYLGRRQASVIPKKKEYLTRRKYGQHYGILDKVASEESERFRFFDFYDFVTANYFETTNKYFSGAVEYAPWFGLPTARVAAEGQQSDMCEGGKYQFIKAPYNPTPTDTTAKWTMQGMPPSSTWPTIELRTIVKAEGATGKLSFYQTEEHYLPSPTFKPTKEHVIDPGEWPTIENGMSIGLEGDIKASEVYTNTANNPYEEYIYISDRQD